MNTRDILSVVLLFVLILSVREIYDAGWLLGHLHNNL